MTSLTDGTVLPAGWAWQTLKDVVEVDSNHLRPVVGSRYPIVGLENIESESGEIRQVPLVDEGSIGSVKYEFGENHILYGRLRPNLNKVALPTFSGGCSTDILVLRTRDHAVKEYVAFWLRSSDFRSYAVSRARGTKMPRLDRDAFLGSPIPVAPEEEQRVIVSVLERAYEIVARRREALSLADAILPAAFFEMFGDPSTEKSRQGFETLGNLAEVRSGVTKGRRLEGRDLVEAPYLRVANVQDGFLDLSEIKYITLLRGEMGKYELRAGDVLITEGGDPDKLGRGCIWREEIEGCVYKNHIFRLRANRERLLPEYLAAVLRTPYARSYFLRSAKRSSNLASINATQVRSFDVPLPPLTDQRKFVSAVQQWNEVAERMKAGQNESEDLLHSLTHHAFAGRLEIASPA